MLCRLRDEASGTGEQAPYHRPEGEHPRDRTDLRHRLPERQSPLSWQGGLHAGAPCRDFPPDEEQRLGRHHPLARAVRHDTAVPRNPA